MSRRVDAHIARTQFGQLMDRAVRNKERFIVDRRGQPAVVILSVQDYIESFSSAPEWLRGAWSEAQNRGLDKLAASDIDAEIEAFRDEKKASAE